MSLDQLTPRERQVLTLRCDLYTCREIGARLGISPRTVQQHIMYARHKVGAGSIGEMLRMVRAELVAKGVAA